MYLLVVDDDFVPIGGSGDGELQGTAERLLRAAGNRQGRSRMSGKGLRSVRPPRALVLATGERVPRGQSLRARMPMVERRPAEVGRVVLSACQNAARQGRQLSWEHFLSWMAERYEEVQRRLRTRVRELRSLAVPSGSHAGLPAALAELQSGWEVWL